MDLNKVMIIGRLTRDPETRTIPSGQTVATFSVATSRQWTDRVSGEKKSQTEFHSVVAWRRLAEICGQYLRKGSQVYIEGYLQTRSWDDPSGQKKYRTEIVCDNMIMLGSKASGAGTAAADGNAISYEPTESQPPAARSGSSTQPAPQEEETVTMEDIPF